MNHKTLSARVLSLLLAVMLMISALPLNVLANDAADLQSNETQTVDQQYTVTFDLNGKDGTAPEVQEIVSDGKVTKPEDPSAKNCAFGGWYKEEACTNAWDFESDTVTENVTLYAKWAETYTVTFDLNGKDGTAPAAQEIVSGGKVTEPTAPTAEGYVVDGWYKSAACKDDEVWNFENDTVSADTILYAQWTEAPAVPMLTTASSPIAYRDPVYTTDGKPASGIKEWQDGSVTCEPVTDSTTLLEGGATEAESKWYVITGTVKTTNIIVKGYVNVILCDGATWNATGEGKEADNYTNPGIKLQNMRYSDPSFATSSATSPASLTIYGQTNNTGELNLSSSGNGISARAAAQQTCYPASLTVNGGKITATNVGNYGFWLYGQGNYPSTLAFTVNGGEITTKNIQVPSASAVINGGTIYDTGDRGIDVSAGSVTINGGDLTVQGKIYGITAGSMTIQGADTKIDASTSESTSGGGAIVCNGNLSIKNVGHKNDEHKNDEQPIKASGTAAGSSNNYGIICKGNLTIENATVEATAINGLGQSIHADGTVVIDHATVNAASKSNNNQAYGIHSGSTVTITNGSVVTCNAESESSWKKAYGIYANKSNDSASVSIEDSTVTATGKSTNDQGNILGYGIYGDSNRSVSITKSTVTACGIGTGSKSGYGIYGGDINITGSSKINATGSNSAGSGYGIYGGTKKTVSITGSDVTATGSGSTKGYGINGGSVTIESASVQTVGTGTNADGYGIYLANQSGSATVSGTKTSVTAEGSHGAVYRKNNTAAFKVKEALVVHQGDPATGDLESVTHQDNENIGSKLNQKYVEIVSTVAYVTINETTKDYSWADALKAANAAGSATITLHENVLSSFPSRIESGKNVTLYLNGYVLKGTTIDNEGTLTIQDRNTAELKVDGKTIPDCYSSAAHYFSEDADGLWVWSGADAKSGAHTVTGGVIIGGTGKTVEGKTLGGAIYNNGTLTIENGTNGSVTLCGNTGDLGGGIYNAANGRLTIKSGTISGNVGKSDGGGLYNANAGTVEVSGGTISDNIGKSDGGGLCNKGTLTITGGTITENTAQNGGGLCNDGVLTMTGGKITANTATENGGGVDNRGKEDNSNSFTIDGTAVISDNKVGDSANNFYVRTNGTVHGRLTVGSSLAAGAKIGVTTDIAGGNAQFTVAGGVAAVQNAAQYFISDNSDYGIKYVEESDMTGHLEIGANVAAVISKDGTSTKKYASVQSAVNAAQTGETVKLLTDINLTDTVNVSADKNITLDLDGHALARLNKDGIPNFAVITNSGTLTVQDSSDAKTGKITGGKGKLILEGKIQICGGGIYNNGTLTIVSGTISGNSANLGGGIFNAEGKTLTINGGTISGNTAAQDGGGIYNDGTLTIAGGTISGNKATKNGGGICSNGMLKMNSGTISGNTATLNGGGIYNNKMLTISGGTFNSNTADQNGGGIYNNKTLTMSGGTFGGNTAVQNGGGIYNSQTLTISGGTFSSNTATLNGGGIYDNGTLKLGGTVQISSNQVSGKANNVYLATGKTIEVGTKTTDDEGNGVPVLASGEKIGITMQTPPTASTRAAFTSNGAAGDAQYFASDDSKSYGLIYNQDGYHELAVFAQVLDANGENPVYYADVQTAVNEAASGSTVQLLEDIDLTATLSVVSGKDFTLDLNGKTLNGSKITDTTKASVITNAGTLMITDSSTAKKGKITGGKGTQVSDATYGGGIYNTGTLTFAEGTVTGNTAAAGGTGIYSTNLATVTGGKIDGSLLKDNSGTLNVSGGKFTQNVATDYWAEGYFCHQMTAETIEGVVYNYIVKAQAVVADIEAQEFTGKKVTPEVTVTDGDKTLTKETDYTVTYGENINVGENNGSVEVHFIGDYSDSSENGTVTDVTKTFNITPMKPKASDFVFAASQSLTYDGTPKAAAVKAKSTVKGMGTVHVYYQYADGWRDTAPTNAGTYRVRINVDQGTNYSAIAELTDENWTFTIEPKEVALEWTAPEDLVYNGEEKVPTASVQSGSLIGQDVCTVSASELNSGSNINLGTFTYKATALSNSNYKLPSDCVSPAYTITPPKAAFVKDGETEMQPEGNVGLEQTGATQSLLKQNGSTVQGTMMYYASETKIENPTVEAIKDWSATVPTGTDNPIAEGNDGKWYIYYYIKGDGKNYVDSDVGETTAKFNYVVVFVSNCDTVVKDQIPDDANKVTEPDLDRDGFTVDGWFESKDFTGTAWNFDTQVQKNTTLLNLPTRKSVIKSLFSMVCDNNLPVLTNKKALTYGIICVNEIQNQRSAYTL